MLKWERTAAVTTVLFLVVVTAAFASPVKAKALPPSVTTADPTNIYKNTATAGGNVTDDGGDPLTGRGVCWSTSPDPTVSDSKTSDGTGTGAFTSKLTGLNPETLYHIRAYATNGAGTSYGEDKIFTTNPVPPPVWIEVIAIPWYLAEGSNAWGFNTYITIMNPNDHEVKAKLTYLDPNPPASGGNVIKSRTVVLPPLSQTTVSSVTDIGEVDFSTIVESPDDWPIAVDRTMYWTGANPNISGYHSSIGACGLSETWYLPEGSSRWGFETWIAVLNPTSRKATVTLSYMTEDSGKKVLVKTVPPKSRATWSMADDIGEADASIKVASDVQVAVERSMYSSGRREGSCSIGADCPNCDFFLAEGAVGYEAGFTTYVLLQNPNDESNEVMLVYQTGTGEVQGPLFTMKPNSRKTVHLNETLPSDTDVSTRVHGSKPIVAERAMYWNSPTGQAFHASIGLTHDQCETYLPDGQDDKNFQTWTLVANPNSQAATVRITYLPQGGGKVKEFTDEIPANSRRSYRMADYVNGRASILVKPLKAGPIFVERAMYGTDWGWGTDTIGGEPIIVQ